MLLLCFLENSSDFNFKVTNILKISFTKGQDWGQDNAFFSRAARCTENIGASRFAMYSSGFDSWIPDFGSVHT